MEGISRVRLVLTIFSLSAIGTFVFEPREVYAGTYPWLGEISLFTGKFAPRGYLPCDGRILPKVDEEIDDLGSDG